MNIHELKTFLAKVEHFILSDSQEERESITFTDNERFGVGSETVYTSKLAFKKNMNNQWILRRSLSGNYKLTKMGHDIMSA